MLSHASRQLLTRSALNGQRRFLQTKKRGPPLENFGAQWVLARDCFANPGITYAKYKVQCEAVRLYAFAFTVAYISFDFIRSPPRSSYWGNWGVLSWPSNFINLLWKDPIEVFLNAPEEYGDNIRPQDALKK